MSAIDRQVPMCDARAACTMQRAWARIRPASSGTLSSSMDTVPLQGSFQALVQGHAGRPAQVAPEAADVGLQVHDLIGAVRHLPEAQRQLRVDPVTDPLDD